MSTMENQHHQQPKTKKEIVRDLLSMIETDSDGDAVFDPRFTNTTRRHCAIVPSGWDDVPRDDVSGDVVIDAGHDVAAAYDVVRWLGITNSPRSKKCSRFYQYAPLRDALESLVATGDAVCCYHPARNRFRVVPGQYKLNIAKELRRLLVPSARGVAVFRDRPNNPFFMQLTDVPFWDHAGVPGNGFDQCTILASAEWNVVRWLGIPQYDQIIITRATRDDEPGQLGLHPPDADAFVYDSLVAALDRYITPRPREYTTVAKADVVPLLPTEYRAAWGEFLDSGLLWYVNRVLCVFGWTINVEVLTSPDGDRVSDDQNNRAQVRYAVPMRTKTRGFDPDTETDRYRRLTKYIAAHANEWLADVTDGADDNND